MEIVKLNELEVGKDIWFKNPYNTFSYWGEVKDLRYNFEGESYAIVQVGTKMYRIDESYTLCVD